MMFRKIYWDLDDVLADFNGYANKVFGTSYKVGQMLDTAHWEILCREHHDMFVHLAPKMDVIELMYDMARNTGQMASPDRKIITVNAILTALPFDAEHPWQYASTDKKSWCDKYLPGFPMFVGPYSHDKQKHCKTGDILIDDKWSNCEEWELKGGVAFLFRDNVKELRDFLWNEIR
jgi:hypothetical protein